MNTAMSDDEFEEELFEGELDRLNGKRSIYPPEFGEPLVSVRICTTSPPDAVLARCREVLGCILRNRPVDWPDNRTTPWPSLETWGALLPEWFVALCAAETTEEKIEAYARRIANLPPEIRDIVGQHTPPPLSKWLDRFKTDRSWLWWDASVISANEIRLRYVVFDCMGHTNWDLSWLLVASGAWRLEWLGQTGGVPD